MKSMTIVSGSLVTALVAGLFVAAATLATAVPATAQVRTFVPSGHVYGPQSGGLPPIDSERSRLNGQIDIYETEIYRSQVEQRQRIEHMKRFIDRDYAGSMRDVAGY